MKWSHSVDHQPDDGHCKASERNIDGQRVTLPSYLDWGSWWQTPILLQVIAQVLRRWWWCCSWYSSCCGASGAIRSSIVLTACFLFSNQDESLYSTRCVTPLRWMWCVEVVGSKVAPRILVGTWYQRGTQNSSFLCFVIRFWRQRKESSGSHSIHWVKWIGFFVYDSGMDMVQPGNKSTIWLRLTPINQMNQGIVNWDLSCVVCCLVSDVTRILIANLICYNLDLPPFSLHSRHVNSMLLVFQRPPSWHVHVFCDQCTRESVQSGWF